MIDDNGVSDFLLDAGSGGAAESMNVWRSNRYRRHSSPCEVVLLNKT